MTLFQNTKIRKAWDKTSQKHWFSVVDICAALRDCDYQAARNYWKWLKYKLICQNNPLVITSKQLKFEAHDGKLRYTDVMDAKEILQLIQIFPGPKAEAFKAWIGKLITDGAKVVKCLTEALSQAKDEVKRRVGGFMKTVRRRAIDLTAADNDASIEDITKGLLNSPPQGRKANASTRFQR